MNPTTTIAALCHSHHALGSDKDLSLIKLQHHLITQLVQQKISPLASQEERLNYAIANKEENLCYGQNSPKPEAG
jgi:hypothetical protein